MNTTTTHFVIWCIGLLAIGCGGREVTPPHEDIPRGAIEAKAGAGRLFFQADDPGTMYVYNVTTTKIVFVQPMEANQQFVVDPHRHRIMLDGKPVLERQTTYDMTLDPRHVHRLYYLPAAWGRPKLPGTPPESTITIMPATSKIEGAPK